MECSTLFAAPVLTSNIFCHTIKYHKHPTRFAVVVGAFISTTIVVGHVVVGRRFLSRLSMPATQTCFP